MHVAIRVIDEYVMGILEAERPPQDAPAEDAEHEQHLLSRVASALDEESTAAAGRELGESFGSPDTKRGSCGTSW